ncbi:MAG TPA: transposase, partial [Ktedonobacteraceae bacterium]|nr:transposase [Ktedonobacteraceae bacterium]
MLGCPDDRLSRSLIEFQQPFGDDAACAQYLAAARWPDGFVCPGCGGGK